MTDEQTYAFGTHDEIVTRDQYEHQHSGGGSYKLPDSFFALTPESWTYYSRTVIVTTHVTFATLK